MAVEKVIPFEDLERTEKPGAGAKARAGFTKLDHRLPLRSVPMGTHKALIVSRRKRLAREKMYIFFAGSGHSGDIILLKKR